MNIPYYLTLSILVICSCKSNPQINEVRILNTNQELAVTSAQIPYVQEYEKFALETMKETHQPGAAIAIVKGSEILYLKGMGVKSFGTTDSVDIHTVFRIASVSKGFAAILAGIMVQEKKFEWDDKVLKYLPDFALKDTFSTHHITIRHILSHTSGLPIHTFTNLIESRVPYETLRDNLRYVAPVAPLGKEFGYQNVVYSLIGDIIRKVTDKPYNEVLTEKVFIPLQMTDASASFESLDKDSNVALPHLKRSDSTFYACRNTPEYYSVLPAAGVNASISDMAKWLLALLGNNPEVISQETLKELFKPEVQVPKRRKYHIIRWRSIRETNYAMGWRVLNYGGETVIYHGGFVNGYRSEIGFCPSQKIGIVVLCNASGKLVNESIPTFFDDYFNHQNKLEIKKAVMTPPFLCTKY